MKKMIIVWLALLGGPVVADEVTASAAKSAQNTCAAETADNLRLACYDRFFKGSGENAAPPVPVATVESCRLAGTCACCNSGRRCYQALKARIRTPVLANRFAGQTCLGVGKGGVDKAANGNRFRVRRCLQEQICRPGKVIDPY